MRSAAIESGDGPFLERGMEERDAEATGIEQNTLGIIADGKHGAGETASTGLWDGITTDTEKPIHIALSGERQD